MKTDSITFDQATRIIQTDGKAFVTRLLKSYGNEVGEAGIVGIGIAERDNRLCFILSVLDERVRELLLRRQVADEEVAGFPVHVEVNRMVSLVGTAGDPLARQRFDPIRALLDRPGLIVLGLIGLAAALFLLLRR